MNKISDEDLDEIISAIVDNPKSVAKELQQFRAAWPKVRAALEFYGRGKHIEDLKNDLENPSGEPENWVCDSDDKFNLENGGFARLALAEYERFKGEK